ncbi:protein DJ-1 homolog C-like [Triticum urartu]|uniref:DJ-1/PfpI domain-containing protein n=1 Tax=Triticum urartu TaxID=4572 RepID=A0A8R7R661_TRIUA|nr:protein DJ-1 homolog C-like [Triticum urartu]XP_048546450.1 protein DJ-1 homolog C-like [Triticum urartu]XP_048546451.1 protein DJ-1 homolog C-like [Triticum urartu]XP_048546452.1 protein DJ-1 homolog C-like [Triticum urartu]
MLSASKPILAPTSLTAMAIRLPPHAPTHYALPHRRTPPFRSIARAAPSPSTTSTAVSLPPSPKKVLVPIAMGTEEMEAVILAGVLRRAGADVTLASVEDGLEVEASYGTRIIADKSIAACANQEFDLVALPGGMPGSVRLRDNEILQRIMVRQAEEKRLYGAICAAPAVVLMPWGLHKGRKITCHPSFIGDLPTFRAVESNVQVSGELTTSRGPGTAFQFALSFVEQLFGPHAVEDVHSTLIDAGLERSTEVNRVEWPFDHKPQVLIPIANGSEEMEIIMLVDILRRANINVVLASVDESTNIVGSQRMKIVADKCILDASDSKYDLIIIPGGPAGAERLHRCTTLKKLLKEQRQASRMYGGICYSPLILQKQGLLQDKTVTAHPSIVNQLTCQVIDRSKVVIDGNLITGKGLGTVMDFSLAIVRKFFGHGRAKGVANGMVFDYPKS